MSQYWSPIRRVPREAWNLYGVVALVQTGVTVVTPLLTPLMNYFDLNFTSAAMAVSALGFSRMLVNVPVGYLVGRASLKKLLAGAVLLAAVGNLYGALSDSFWQVLVSRLIMGLASGVVQTIVVAWLVEISTARNRGTVMSMSEAAFSLSSTVSPLVSGVLASLVDWRWSFAFVGGCALLALPVVLTIPGESPMAGPRSASGVETVSFSPIRLFKAGGLALISAYLITIIIFVNRHGFYYTFVPFFAGKSLGLSPSAIGLAFALTAFAGLMATIAGGLVGDRFGLHSLVLPMGAWLVAAQVAFVPVSWAWGFPPAMATLPFTYSINGLPGAFMGEAVPVGLRGLSVTVYRVLADALSLVVPVLVGRALDLGGISYAVGLCAAVVLASVVGLVPEVRRRYEGKSKK